MSLVTGGPSELHRALSATRWPASPLTSLQAQALRADIVRRGAATSWAAAQSMQTDVGRELAATAWADVPGARLLVLGESYFALAHARDHFLRSDAAPAAAAGRWLLYLHMLWRRAEGFKADPRAVLLRALVAADAGPAALREVERRLDLRTGQVGAYAALLVMLSRWSEFDPDAAPPDDAEVGAVAQRLRRVAARHLPPALRRLPDVDDELLSTVGEVLLSRYGAADPIDLLARALDGGLNIAPRAIANATTKRLMEQCKHGADERSIEVVFPREPSHLPHQHAALEDGERQRLARRLARRARAMDAPLVAAIDEALHADVSQAHVRAAAARILGITPQGLGLRLRKVRRRLLDT